MHVVVLIYRYLALLGKVLSIRKMVKSKETTL